MARSPEISSVNTRKAPASVQPILPACSVLIGRRDPGAAENVAFPGHDIRLSLRTVPGWFRCCSSCCRFSQIAAAVFRNGLQRVLPSLDRRLMPAVAGARPGPTAATRFSGWDISVLQCTADRHARDPEIAVNPGLGNALSSKLPDSARIDLPAQALADAPPLHRLGPDASAAADELESMFSH